MGAVHFLLALHNHQPVGNFENVFREAFEKCYEPLIHFLEEHPPFRLTLHYSGCLFDWFEGRERRFLKRLQRLVRKNQVELMSGGYYEPILTLIPERDAKGQIGTLNDYLHRRFGQHPLGFWLAERIWEPKLARLIAQAGLKYTAVDDTHFSLAGLSESEIKNFFLTEEEGFPLYLFPISKFLRYAVPFREPHEVITYLQNLASETTETVVATYADDGEKFGLWPGTYQWVYRDGWLERFARALEENSSWLTLKTFREVLEENQDRLVRKVYLPTASYEEMSEWALSRERALEFIRLKRELEPLGFWNRTRVFFQGGTFKNFLVKYTEADWMMSRGNWVSRRVEGMRKGPKKREAQQELWQAQCNCPYWHGIFGGLYLHHLRRSTYEHLIRSEGLCGLFTRKDPPHLAAVDLNHDGLPEIAIVSPPFSFYFFPHRGGSLMELDFHPEAMNVLDTLMRREEAYHQEFTQRKDSQGGGGKSIHELERVVPREVLERVGFDRWERLSLLDHFLPLETSLVAFWKGRFESFVKDPTRVSFVKNWRKEKGKGTLTMRGKIGSESWEGAVGVEKRIGISSGKNPFEITWRLTNESQKTIDCLWGSEWSFNFYDREREEKQVREVEIQDGWSPLHLEIKGEEPFDYWQFPIETVAQTEADFRLIHQGISVFPHWKISLKTGESLERHLRFYFSSRR